MPKAPNPLTPKLFTFLRELAKNNERPWFQANKARYEACVRDPLLAFIAAVEPELELDGKLFRVYRDTRFALDKTPYKTHAAVVFRHGGGDDATGPVFYLHLEPGSVFAGAGIWRPSTPTLKRIRDAIVARPAAWKTACKAKGCALDDDEQKLSRPPRGYDPEHPAIEDLKRKNFITSATLTEKIACAPDFVTRYVAICRSARPLTRFLASATLGDG
jgi:uncharacterized protein (TIGR02453 family)